MAVYTKAGIAYHSTQQCYYSVTSTYVHQKTYTRMFIIALYTGKPKPETTQMSTNSRMWYSHTIENCNNENKLPLQTKQLTQTYLKLGKRTKWKKEQCLLLTRDQE